MIARRAKEKATVEPEEPEKDMEEPEKGVEEPEKDVEGPACVCVVCLRDGKGRQS